MPATEEKAVRYGLAALTYSDALFSAIAELVKTIALHDARAAKKAIVERDDIDAAVPKAFEELRQATLVDPSVPESELIAKIQDLIQKYSNPAS